MTGIFPTAHSPAHARRCSIHCFTEGVSPALPLTVFESGPAQTRARIAVLRPTTAATHSDAGYLILAGSWTPGGDADQFARDNIFIPLHMDRTTYRPPGELKFDIAPTGEV